MKRIFALALVLILCVSCACADWTCGVCGYTWQDGNEYCDECGFNAPVHGLKVTAVGDDSIMLKWYGETTGCLTLMWCVSGTGSWHMIDNITGKGYVLSGLESNTSYDVRLMVDYESVVGMVTATTTGVTPTPEPK